MILGDLGLLPAQLALCPGDDYPLTGACPDQVCFEFGNHCQDIEQELPDWIGVRCQTDSPMPSLNSRRVSSSTMSSRIAQRPGQAVEFGHDQGAPVLAGSYTKVHNRILRPVVAADKGLAPAPIRPDLATIERHIRDYIDNSRLENTA